jgi:hypothetical protein
MTPRALRGDLQPLCALLLRSRIRSLLFAFPVLAVLAVLAILARVIPAPLPLRCDLMNWVPLSAKSNLVCGKEEEEEISLAKIAKTAKDEKIAIVPVESRARPR